MLESKKWLPMPTNSETRIVDRIEHKETLRGVYKPRINFSTKHYISDISFILYFAYFIILGPNLANIYGYSFLKYKS